MEPTIEQKEFIEEDGKESLILLATAGSGKTASCVKKLKYLTDVKNVDPKKIIFFSFTKAAVEELQDRIGRDDIEITTIHSFCFKVLNKANRFKNVATIHDFLRWFKEHMKPKNGDKQSLESFKTIISEMYEEADSISSSITKYKLLKLTDTPCPVPEHYQEYLRFLKETKSRDFVDMLVEVNRLFELPLYLSPYLNKYDYIFIDEYQDTSSIQLDILLKLNAKRYFLIGDKNQSIYGFSGSNSDLLDKMISDKKEVKRMTLSTNFRSDILIVENSNQYSSIEAIANSKKNGFISRKIITSLADLQGVFSQNEEVAVLVRTNKTIKDLELKLLKRKIKVRYNNLFNSDDLDNLMKQTKYEGSLKFKFDQLKNYFRNGRELVEFILNNKESKKFITTIHKAKGKEFETCVVVNSLDPQMFLDNKLHLNYEKKDINKMVIDYNDDESVFIHYVAITRPKNKLYYMAYV